MEACYGGTDVMERSCAVARGIDINRHHEGEFIIFQNLAVFISERPGCVLVVCSGICTSCCLY